ncbi:hypothetical protein F0Q45_25090 [Mycobacterium simiae]|uniref:Uncharacterized protein n=1 Tax=Mycobacterium simiae TaxID=1784 RepID=A0A5B1B9X8_MYCSI|nr:hypothetical protein F0Q45_25090 [Mycobacterium simiae]
MSDDSSSAFDVICAEIERQLQGGEVSMAAHAAFELLLAVQFQLDTPPQPSSIAHGALYQAVEAARAQIYGRLSQLWTGRRDVLDARRQQWLSGHRDVRALLVDVLNVLLAGIAAADVEWAYSYAERRAMAAAVVAEICGDAVGVAEQRDAVGRAAADALRELAHGTVASEGRDHVSPVDLIRAEVARRVRGEVSTDFIAAGELKTVVRHVLDTQPGNDLTYGPLCQGARAARESIYQCLVQLWQARRSVTRADRDMRDIRSLLVDLENLLREVAAAAAIEQAYARAERQAMASAIVAEIRGDTLRLEAQHDTVQQAAADAMQALQELTAR